MKKLALLMILQLLGCSNYDAKYSLKSFNEGDVAHYILNKDPKRTTRGFKSGFLKLEILGETENQIQLKTTYKISHIFSTKQGEKIEYIDKALVDGTALKDLRDTKFYEYRNVKFEHHGYATVPVGNIEYENCDKVFSYTEDERVEEAKAFSWIHPSIPIFGAARIDSSGKQDGTAYKLGFDYKQ